MQPGTDPHPCPLHPLAGFTCKPTHNTSILLRLLPNLFLPSLQGPLPFSSPLPGRQRERCVAFSLGNPAKPHVDGNWWQGTLANAGCFFICSTCCPRRPSKHFGNQHLTSGCGSPMRYRCHSSWVFTFSESHKGQKSLFR